MTVTAVREVPGETISNPWMRAYARTKLLGEEAISEAAQSVEYVIFRPTVVVDVPDVLAAIPKGKLSVLLRGKRNAHHVYVWDVAEALIWAMERSFHRASPAPSIRIYNLSDETLEDPTLAGLRAEGFAKGLCPASPKSWPSAVDRAVEYLRHNCGRWPRIPMPYLRFPADRLLRDGFRYPHGMRVVRDKAFASMRRELVETVSTAGSRPSGSEPSST